MGYSHVIEIIEKPTVSEWNDFIAKVRIIFEHANHLGIHIVYESDIPNPPKITENMLRFNGLDEDGFETFLIHRRKMKDCCKTGRKPYDRVVASVLWAMKEVMGSKVRVGNDDIIYEMTSSDMGNEYTYPEDYLVNLYLPGLCIEEAIEAPKRRRSQKAMRV